MAVNIGPKIGIDGEREYRKQINDLITQQKTFNSQMRELESSFDETTSAMEKNRKKSELLEKQIKNQEKQVDELEKGLKESAKKYGENANETKKWQQAVNNAKTDLNKLKGELNKIPKPIKAVGKAMQETGKKISSFGDKFTRKISAPVAALGGLSIAAFNEVDEGLDTVTKKTGATGAELESLQSSVKTLATQIPTDFATAGEAIGEVNTRFGLTGSELEDLSGKFVKFAQLNNTDVSSSIDSVQKVMSAFGVDTKDAGKVLDVLNRTGQKTGVSMDTLESSMLKNSTALQEMGMDAYTAADFIGRVETSGANTETVMQGMSKALTNAAKDGKTLPEALGEFQAVMQSSASDQEKLNKAIDLFGKKAGPAIYEACKQGSLSFEDLSNDASEYLGSVETTFENTLDAPDEMKISLNKLKETGSELGGTLLKIATPAIEGIGEAAEKAGGLFDDLTEDQQEMVGYVVTALAVGGPAVTACGNLVTAAGKIVEAFGAVPGAIAKISGVALPVGLAIGAFTLLKMGIDAANDEAIASVDGLAEMMESSAAATGELNSAVDDMKQTINGVNGNIEEIESKAATANKMVEELYKLDAVTNKTASQQAKMKAIVADLNKMYPNLGLSIDDTTGKLNKGKKEVKDYIQEAKRLAMIDAYAAGAKTSYEKLAAANKALYDAQQEQAKGLDVYQRAYHAYYEAMANAPKDAQTGQALYTEEVQKADTAQRAALASLEELNGAVNNAEAAIADAEKECEFYTDQQNELAGETEAATEATEDNTKATDDNTEAQKENGKSVKAKAADVADAVSGVIKDLTKEVAAWDELYNSTKESIENQVGLFDAWEQDTEITAQNILENLTSQVTGMNNYADNMSKLSAAAVESSDPNFKALVQSIAEMGVDGAAYAQELVEAMEGDKDTFNAILDQFGEKTKATENLAEVETYVASGFKTRTAAALSGVVTAANNLGKSPGFQHFKENAATAVSNVQSTLQKAVAEAKTTGEQTDANLKKGYENLPATAETAAKSASSKSKEVIDKTKYNPKVDKITVPESVTTSATNKMSKELKPTAKVTSISTEDAAEKARNALQNWFNNNPITARIKQIVQKVKSGGGADNNAEGGIIEKETLSWLAEGDKPEAVIPLDVSKRARALQLYEQTGRALGVDTIMQQSTVIDYPGGSTRASETVKIDFDQEELYAAVARGAAAGMESANIKIYWDNREAGRIMRDMGVQFA